jgi:hypothetical protein
LRNHRRGEFGRLLHGTVPAVPATSAGKDEACNGTSGPPGFAL